MKISQENLLLYKQNQEVQEKKSTKQEIIELFRDSFMNIFEIFATVPIMIASIYYLSQSKVDNEKYVASYGLGMTIVESVGITLIISLNSGLFTQASQTLGALEEQQNKDNKNLQSESQNSNENKNHTIELAYQQHDHILISRSSQISIQYKKNSMKELDNIKQVGILVYRAWILGAIHIALLVPLFLNLDSLLQKINISPEMSESAKYFSLSCLFSLVFQSLWDSLRQFMLAHQEFSIPLKIQNTVYLIGPFFCFVFVSVFQLNLLGVALARNLTDFLCFIWMFYATKTEKKFAKSWAPFDFKVVMSNIIGYAKITLPIGATMYLEWAFFELMTIFVGILNDINALAGYSIFFSIIFLFWGVPLGFSWTVNSYMGNVIGQGNAKQAKKLIKIILASTLFLCISFIFLGHVLKPLFDTFLLPQDASELNEQFTICYFMYLDLVFLPDSFQAVLGAILKSCGYQNYTAISFVFIYYLFGLPISYILIFPMGYGMPAVWFSEFVLASIISIWFFYKLYNLNIEFCIKQVQDRVENDIQVSGLPLQEIK